jgi:hypothetical protein
MEVEQPSPETENADDLERKQRELLERKKELEKKKAKLDAKRTLRQQEEQMVFLHF